MTNEKQEEATKANDGTTLDIAIDDEEELPSGLARIRSGVIAVTRVFCPNGHNLVDESSGARFNGYPGIAVNAKGRHTGGKVILSPIHGDDTRFGETDFEPGEILEVTCPVCGVALPVIGPCGCQEDSKLVGLYLDEKLEDGNQVALCNAWGCLRSRITDRFQIISKLD
ncbi:MAG: hypothetical protein R6V85_06415 [Polyangia bacterium]